MFDPPKCPSRDGAVTAKTDSFSGFVGRLVGAELLTYVLAGLLFAIRFVWPPALLLGFAFAAYIFFIRKGGGVRYVCASCHAAWKYSDLYHKKAT